MTFSKLARLLLLLICGISLAGCTRPTPVKARRITTSLACHASYRDELWAGTAIYSRVSAGECPRKDLMLLGKKDLIDQSKTGIIVREDAVEILFEGGTFQEFEPGVVLLLLPGDVVKLTTYSWSIDCDEATRVRRIREQFSEIVQKVVDSAEET